jgi:hypothetical protein
LNIVLPETLATGRRSFGNSIHCENMSVGLACVSIGHSPFSFLKKVEEGPAPGGPSGHFQQDPSPQLDQFRVHMPYPPGDQRLAMMSSIF